MKKIIYIFLCTIIYTSFFSLRAIEPSKDDISIFAAEMIDSLRHRGNKLVNTHAHPQRWDSALSKLRCIFDAPRVADYTEGGDKQIQPNKLVKFEKDFHIKYLYNESLLPSYFKANNVADTFPIFSRLGFIPFQQDTIMNYLGPITGVEIGIVPELHSNHLIIKLFLTYLYWDPIEKKYYQLLYNWWADGEVITENTFRGARIFEYTPGVGWKRTTEVEWDSLWTNEIPILCLESAKVSAARLAKDENIDSAFIDWRYIGQYVIDQTGNRISVIPDYALDMQQLNLKYLCLSPDPECVEKYKLSDVLNIATDFEILKNGAYFLRPKYRLDGDRFYVEVEVYFAKVDDDKHLSYDLRSTDHYTYQLDSDNQWQLLK